VRSLARAGPVVQRCRLQCGSELGNQFLAPTVESAEPTTFLIFIVIFTYFQWSGGAASRAFLGILAPC